MQFNPKQYLAIDIANSFGLDKDPWSNRLQWVKDNYQDLEAFKDKADDKFLFIKGIKTLRAVDKGEPTGFIMGLDATASGYQVMAALSGCRKTASAVNLINTGKREDLYTYVANHMNQNYGTKVTRSQLKTPIMTVGYGSKAQPKKVFGEDTTELKAFYGVLQNNLEGAMSIMELLLDCWNNKATEHSFRMPDGHTVILPVTRPVQYFVKSDHWDNKVVYQADEKVSSNDGTSIIANVVHSVDGYIAREMVRRADKQGFQLAHIHDSFWASPVYMNEVRQNYINILAEIADSDLLANIMSQITKTKVTIDKDSTNLSKLIRKSEYALS